MWLDWPVPLPLAWRDMPLDIAAVPRSIWLIGSWYALSASVFCLWLWYRGLAHVEAWLAGLTTAAIPVTALAGSTLVLAESIEACKLLGGGLVLAASGRWRSPANCVVDQPAIGRLPRLWIFSMLTRKVPKAARRARSHGSCWPPQQGFAGGLHRRRTRRRPGHAGARDHADRKLQERRCGAGRGAAATFAALDQGCHPRRHHRRARCGQVDGHRPAWHEFGGAGPSPGGIGRGSQFAALRRLHPRRQDAHGAPGTKPGGLHPALADIRYARWCRAQDP